MPFGLVPGRNQGTAGMGSRGQQEERLVQPRGGHGQAAASRARGGRQPLLWPPVPVLGCSTLTFAAEIVGELIHRSCFSSVVACFYRNILFLCRKWCLGSCCDTDVNPIFILQVFIETPSYRMLLLSIAVVK